MMKIAITGATGHIGSNLCPYLLVKGFALRILVYESDVNYNGVEVVKGNILDSKAVRALVEGVDVVVHLAARISLEPDKDGMLRKVNVEGTRNVVNACIEHKITKLIHFSSIHTFNPYPLDEPLTEARGYMEEGTDYDYSKIEGEKIVLQAQEKGLKSTILCPTSVFGPNDWQPSLLGSAIVDMYKGKVPMLVPGGYDFVDVRDIVDATYQSITKEMNGEKYLLPGYYLTIQQFAALISKVSGKRISQRVLPMAVLRALLPVFRMQSWLAGKPPIFSKQSLKALMEGHDNVSSAKAEKDLDYSKRSLEDSMRDTLEWFKKNGEIN